MQTGCQAGVHGVIDDYYLDHRRGRIVPQSSRRICPAALAEVIAAADPAGQAVREFIKALLYTRCMPRVRTK